MPVNNTHPDYDAALPDWLRARDVLAGENAVKSAGEKYLPRLDSQSDEEFLANRKRASFFNSTAQTGERFFGLRVREHTQNYSSTYNKRSDNFNDSCPGYCLPF